MVGHGCGCGNGRGSEPAATSPAAGGGGKRGRNPEEDVYVDNLHSHKRYLSEIMACSMNRLSVEDSAADNKTTSAVRPENAPCFRDEMFIQYSPTSEDIRSYDTQVNTSRNQTDTSSPSTSPISSPNRIQKPNICPSSGNPYPLPSCSFSALASSNVRCGTEHEGRIPSSPNDMSHGGDLRRTALLRSVQMRVHDLEQERAQVHADELEHKDENLEGVELEHRSCPRLIQDAAFG